MTRNERQTENFVDEIALEAKALRKDLKISSREAIQLVLATKAEQYADAFIDNVSVDQNDLTKSVERDGIDKISNYGKQNEDKNTIDYDGIPIGKQI